MAHPDVEFITQILYPDRIQVLRIGSGRIESIVRSHLQNMS